MVLFGWRSRRHRSSAAARDLGPVVHSRDRFPPALLGALLPLGLLVVLNVWLAWEGGLVYGVAAVPYFLLAAALALGWPRAWAWGVYGSLLLIPGAILKGGFATALMGVPVAAIVFFLTRASVRRYFAQECPVVPALGGASGAVGAEALLSDLRLRLAAHPAKPARSGHAVRLIAVLAGDLTSPSATPPCAPGRPTACAPPRRGR